MINKIRLLLTVLSALIYASLCLAQNVTVTTTITVPVTTVTVTGIFSSITQTSNSNIPFTTSVTSAIVANPTGLNSTVINPILLPTTAFAHIQTIANSIPHLNFDQILISNSANTNSESGANRATITPTPFLTSLTSTTESNDPPGSITISNTIPKTTSTFCTNGSCLTTATLNFSTSFSNKAFENSTTFLLFPTTHVSRFETSQSTLSNTTSLTNTIAESVNINYANNILLGNAISCATIFAIISLLF